jgi:Tfp pilus assembly protein PilF
MVWLSMFVLVWTTAFVLAEGPDDAYIRHYNALQQADSLNQAGHYRAAAEKYLEVQTSLKKFQAQYPTWSPKMVTFRLNYATQRLESLVKFLPPPSAPEAPPQANPSAAFALSSGKKAAAKSELESKIDGLNNELRRLESEKSNLEEKLQEALKIKPAEVDPQQLAHAEQKLTELAKERDLLKVSLEQERAKVAKLEQEPKVDPGIIRQLEAERNELKRQLAQALEGQTSLESRYQQRIQVAEGKMAELETLQQERDELNKKLKIAEARMTAASETKERKPTKSDLKEFQKLETEKEQLEIKFYGLAKELSTLQSERERELKSHQAALAKIRKLEEERDVLQAKLYAAAKGAPVDPTPGAPSASPELSQQIQQLHAKLAAYEAKAIPFTPEELALFRKPGASSASAYYLATKPSVRDLSPKAQQLVEEADRDFMGQRFADAEKKYQQVLNQGDKNVYALANLASTQIEMNRLEDAEHNLKRALLVQPEDPFSLLLLGKVKMSENNIEEAFNALSRSVQLNPHSAEAQNYLGIVLSEKGQRTGAEAALRKAIQIQPNYPSAHHNLAIIYATQKPPFTELARWHYDKAVELGHPKNADLEKMMGN